MFDKIVNRVLSDVEGARCVLLAGDDLDLRGVRPGRHLAQELDEDLAGPGAVGLLPTPSVVAT